MLSLWSPSLPRFNEAATFRPRNLRKLQEPHCRFGRFNEAATFRPRNRLSRTIFHVGLKCFNEAATFRPRNHVVRFEEFYDDEGLQ